MHSEWSAEHVTPPIAPTPPPWVAPTGGAERVGSQVRGAPPIDGPTAVDGSEAAAEAAAEAEEDLHRSAVDAVDRLLDEVELALERLDDGTYGRCEGCGSPIDDQRLAGRPIVRTCGQFDEVDSEIPTLDPVASVRA